MVKGCVERIADEDLGERLAIALYFIGKSSGIWRKTRHIVSYIVLAPIFPRYTYTSITHIYFSECVDL